MGAREFPIVAVRRADFGPKVRAARIVCARCGETDEVVVGADRRLGPWIEKKFAGAGWAVGANDSRDFCPGCAGKTGIRTQEAPKMAKVVPPPIPAPSVAAATVSRTEDARKARLDVDLMLVDNFDPARGRYREGWDDERVAREAGMSVEFVAKRREAEHGALRAEVSGERLSALLSAFEAETKARDSALTERLREAEAALVALEKEARAGLRVMVNAIVSLRALSGTK